MCMSDSEVTIRPVTNGYIIRFRDPKIVAENKKQRKKDEPYEWKDASKEIACKSLEEVTSFLGKTLKSILPAVDFDTAYSNALKEK